MLRYKSVDIDIYRLIRKRTVAPKDRIGAKEYSKLKVKNLWKVYVADAEVAASGIQLQFFTTPVAFSFHTGVI